MRTLSFVVLLLTSLAGQPPAKAKNVVFILADDLGWRDLGSYGTTFYETPNLDRLASEGIRFTQAYAACPVCSPTRASIMAGKYPARMDTTDWFGGQRKGRLLPAPYVPHLPLEELTLGEAFKAAGYRTGFVGKWHLGGGEFLPTAQGFDVNQGGCAYGHPKKGYFAPFGIPNLEEKASDAYLTDRMGDEAIAFLDAAKEEEQPFFLFLSFYQVHTPLQGKPELVEKYRKKSAQLPKGTGPRFVPEGERQARQVQDHAIYAAMVESMDHNVGRVLAKLADLGHTNDTLVVFTSDNGGLSTSEGSPTSNVPLRAGKGWLYEGGIREPLIMRWPAVIKPGSVTDVPVTSPDYYPTLMAATGLPERNEQHLDGTNLLPVLRGGALPPRSLYWHYPHYGNQGGAPSGAIRRGDLKLIEWFESGKVELFDLSKDLSETTDLSLTRQEETSSLQAELAQWRTAMDAKMPRPNPAFKDR